MKSSYARATAPKALQRLARGIVDDWETRTGRFVLIPRIRDLDELDMLLDLLAELEKVEPQACKTIILNA